MPTTAGECESNRLPHRVFPGVGAALGAALILATGCNLFDQRVSNSQQTQGLIPAMKPAPDAVLLDILFVERPLGDALLGPELWRQVDEVGAVPQDGRALLAQNGFRVGVVGSQPPPALETLLGMSADFLYEKEAQAAKQLVGHHVAIPAGGETVINVSPAFEQCNLKLHQAGESFDRPYLNARGVFKVTTHREQDGWIRLEFVPEVHHGDDTLRHVAGENGWQFSNGQKVESLFAQRFSVVLAVGEMVVLTAADGARDTLGPMFFVSRGAATGKQRLLVVRLSDMRRLDDPYHERR